MHTNSGEVPVDVAARADGRFVATLTSIPPRHRQVPDDVLDAALDTFGWTRDDLDSQLPSAEAFAGAWHLVIALESRKTLAAMRYRFDDLRALMVDRGLTTIQVVWRQDATTFHARDPFPAGGVIEDAATGAAAAALGGYLRASGLVAVPTDLVIRQGDDMGRPSVISVHVPSAGGIAVTGTAVAGPV